MLIFPLLRYIKYNIVGCDIIIVRIGNLAVVFETVSESPCINLQSFGIRAAVCPVIRDSEGIAFVNTIPLIGIRFLSAGCLSQNGYRITLVYINVSRE